MCARNGSCISSECSRACACGLSTTTYEAAAIAFAQSASIGAMPNGVSKPPDGIDRDALETDEVRRPDEHGDVERPVAQEPVGVRGDRPGIQQPRVRRDERGQLASQRRRIAIGVPEMVVDRRRERRSGSRIPAACHRSGTYAHY